MHTVPFIVTFVNTIQSDVIYMESDWFFMPILSLLYLFVNFCVSEYSGKEQVYILRWTRNIQYLEFIPFIIMSGYMLVLLSTHFTTCIITQVLRQRYEADFENYQ